MKSPITTHILNTQLGQPAKNVSVKLFMCTSEDYRLMAQSKTDNDGRIMQWPVDFQPQIGSFRLEFDTQGYFTSLQETCFYPRVVIDFKIDDVQQHYHVPLLLAAHGYSTYRGS